MTGGTRQRQVCFVAGSWEFHPEGRLENHEEMHYARPLFGQVWGSRPVTVTCSAPVGGAVGYPLKPRLPSSSVLVGCPHLGGRLSMLPVLGCETALSFQICMCLLALCPRVVSCLVLLSACCVLRTPLSVFLRYRRCCRFSACIAVPRLGSRLPILGSDRICLSPASFCLSRLSLPQGRIPALPLMSILATVSCSVSAPIAFGSLFG
jgi:hypothetical protein